MLKKLLLGIVSVCVLCACSSHDDVSSPKQRFLLFRVLEKRVSIIMCEQLNIQEYTSMILKMM